MNPLASPLLTDLYQLTMLNAYRAHAMEATAVFELFVRRLPPRRNFMIAAGLEQALEFLSEMRFSDEEVEWVRSSGLFGHGFADALRDLRFSGDVHAMPEGTVFFPEEPILRITAPMLQAQLVETRLINVIQFQSMIASKAARSTIVGPGKQLVDFGLRRAHGAEAGVFAARASYIAGFAGTATVIAAPLYGIPLFGTMAHSFVQAHDRESDAFAHFLETYPSGTTLLIDTYDTERAARKIADLMRELRSRGVRLGAVRLDSGDIASLAQSVRAILDAAGLSEVRVFASGNLDEYRVKELLDARAPIDGFGVGTSLVTSADAPSLDAVYKLQEYAGEARRKCAARKSTWPGRKQVFRRYTASGEMDFDVVNLESESGPGDPLLVKVMENGRRITPPESLARIRERAASQLSALPERLRALESAREPYRVEIASPVQALAREIDEANRAGANRDAEA